MPNALKLRSPGKGRVVVLNGGSSAGKTSLSQALQDIMDEIYVLMGIDMFWMSLPPAQLDLDRVEPEVYSWQMEDHAGKPQMKVVPGPILDELMLGRYTAIQSFLDRGFNVIADEVFWQRSWLDECLQRLADYELHFIKVFCSDEEGSRREKARGDRHAGWNRGSSYYTDRDMVYDLVVDTTTKTPPECALAVKSYLDRGMLPTAARTMRARLIPKF